MKIKYAVLLVLAIQGLALGAGKEIDWLPQPGYWYNDTDYPLQGVLYARAPKGYETFVTLEPHELVKMAPFKKTELFAGGGNSIMFSFAEKGASATIFGSLNRGNLGSQSREYVVMFQNDPTSDSGFKFSIMPEKEFREKYAKELEALPLPGGVQCMIPGYLFPEAEKPQAKE